jgi:hypothetical protein
LLRTGTLSAGAGHGPAWFIVNVNRRACFVFRRPWRSGSATLRLSAARVRQAKPGKKPAVAAANFGKFVPPNHAKWMVLVST